MTTTYRGIFYRPRKGGWRAKIYHENKSIWLGTWSDEKEAAMAYDAAARKLHGPDAKLNFRAGYIPIDIRAKVAATLVAKGLITP